MAGKPKLHEILAVEKGLETAATEAITEGTTTLSKKPTHFLGWHKRYEPFDEALKIQESTEENQALTTTVDDKLRFVFKHITRWFDAVLQKESTNQAAKADIELEGQVLAKDVPATMLLGLESKCKQLRTMLEAIPTLQPGALWQLDPSKGVGVYVDVHPEKKFKTKKMTQSRILVDATKEHPAQIDKWNEDVNVGITTTNTWCSMKSTAEKSAMLGRLDVLERAVKKARQRANNTEVVHAKIGKQITDFLLAEQADKSADTE